MPVALAMKFRMSFRLALLKRISSGSRRAGFRSGGSADAARARSRIADDRRLRPRRLDAIADRLVEAPTLATAAVARIVFGGELVFAERRFELILLFELPRPIEVRTRRGEHRALERDLVVRVVRIGLHGAAIGGDRFVEIARARRGLALAKRLACGAADAQASASATSTPSSFSRLVIGINQQSASVAALSSSALSSQPVQDPLSRIVCRPRPSRCAISIDSTPIFRMR